MIYVIGSINLDLIVNVKRLPQAGETLLGKTFKTAAGGKSANQALAASRAGSSVTMVGAVGNDKNAELALAELKRAEINLSNVKKTDESTGIAMISVADNGENSIIVVAGANGTVSPDMALQAINEMGQNDIVLLAQEIPEQAIETALKAAKNAKITSILNIAPFSDKSKTLAKLADIVIANETEFAALIGQELKRGFEHELCALAKRNQQIIIVTLGADGALGATSEGKLIKVQALKIKPIDSVGAGDSFCGYLAAMLEQGKPLKEAMQIASIAGSLACLKQGAQPAIPFLSEVVVKV
ncbi:MAG: ribokinase [Devosiaceae bacterium]|nr:ribokinase [Devosiaceae bacterium]